MLSMFLLLLLLLLTYSLHPQSSTQVHA